MHKRSEPEILYFGTPVVLISTCNEDGSFNIAPISSIFWLGWRCVIGISALSKTTENISRNRECVLNLPSVNEVSAVNRLALTTGSHQIPEGKKRKGYIYVRNKFSQACLTTQISDTVSAPRIKECPVQMEARLEDIHGIAENNPKEKGKILTMEFKIQRVYLEESIIMDDYDNRVDPDKWKPLIMSFQKFYSLSEQVQNSKLAQIPEYLYHSQDMDNARN
ncbi:MAG TPA: flavin reductase family protein [Puia sp.]|jgi:flavin reductase (DIM6/NTAB) family NADH-FMN oxidoreductase RutF|nr:flavin reductase family protein [Puia sp.]